MFNFNQNEDVDKVMFNFNQNEDVDKVYQDLFNSEEHNSISEENDDFKWIIPTWSRSELRLSEFNSRTMKFYDLANPREYKFKMAQITISVKVYTNDTELGEDLEEFLNLQTINSKGFGIEVEDIGTFNCGISSYEVHPIEIEPREDNTVLVTNGYSLVLNFPILSKPEDKKILREIVGSFNLYINQDSYVKIKDFTIP